MPREEMNQRDDYLNTLHINRIFVPIPVAARSQAYVCGCSLARIAGSNPARRQGYLSIKECCVFSRRDLCDRPIPRPATSYRLCRVTERGHVQH